jgi:hypothetical protein
MDMEITQRLDQLDEFGQQLLAVEQNIQVQMATQAVYSDFWLDLASGWVAYGGRERHSLLFMQVYGYTTPTLRLLCTYTICTYHFLPL